MLSHMSLYYNRTEGKHPDKNLSGSEVRQKAGSGLQLRYLVGSGKIAVQWLIISMFVQVFTYAMANGHV